MNKESQQLSDAAFLQEYERHHEYWLNVGKCFLKCQRTLNQLLLDLDISIAQHEILLTLRRNGEMTHKELSERMLVVKSNISNLVKKLVQRNLLEVMPSTQDQRVKFLRLTAAGQVIVRKSAAIQKQVVSAMVSGSSDRDLAATNRVMLRAIAALDNVSQ